MNKPKMTFDVHSRRIDSHVSHSACIQAEIRIDTDLAGIPNAFNPAELLLAALTGCMIKSIERVAPILDFTFRGVEVRVHGVRQDVPPKFESIEYEIIVDTDETDHRLEILHDNVRKFGTVFNTVSSGTILQGTCRKSDLSVVFSFRLPST